jgi:glycosyltransferase involved in cell wall biosynthesis
MHILFVVPYTPNLIRTRPYNLIRQLARRGHDLTVLTLTTNAAEAADVEALRAVARRVIALPLSRWRSLANVLAALPTPQPLQAAYCWQPGIARQLHDLLVSNNGHQPIDVVHVEHLRGARYALAATRHSPLYSTPLPIVWDSVDCITHLFRQAATQSHSFSGRWMARLDLRRTARYEGWLAWQFDAVLATSAVDCDALVQLAQPYRPVSRPPLHVLPNGVDLNYFHSGPVAGREPATLIFSGKMSYHANITMARTLVQEVMPLVWAHRPETQLWIAGKDPGQTVLALAGHPAVSVTGTVPDLRPYLRRATMAVVPMTYGAGSQFKVLEAMSCGTPVVATTQALSALSARPGRDLLVGEDSAGLAQAILTLLDEPQRRSAIAAAGRAYVETHHDWGDVAAQLEAIYHSLLDRHSTYQQQPATKSRR